MVWWVIILAFAVMICAIIAYSVFGVQTTHTRADCGAIMEHGVEENGCWKWERDGETHICCVD